MNIYVGNLSREVSEDDLREAFQAYGQITTVNVIKDKFTNESRGFGFVEMPNKEEALMAIDELKGKELKGQAINVNEARPKTDDNRGGNRQGGNRRSSGGSGGYGGGGNRRSSGGSGGGGGRFR